nr:4-alpha-glucanotransferase [Candidatus Pantoea persica]
MARRLHPAGKGRYQWRLRSEKGREFSGELEAGEAFTLPSPLGHGYHQLTLSKGKRQWQTLIILTPRRCWLPEPLRNGGKHWGVLVQLYTVRSASNWGIGDFGYLAQLLELVARQGGDFVGLNPLHALYPAMPDFASPSSRRWLNIIYIDVAQLEDFQQSAAAQKW